MDARAELKRLLSDPTRSTPASVTAWATVCIAEDVAKIRKILEQESGR